MLGLLIDRDLSFTEYFSSLCQKAGRKLSLLAKISNQINFQERNILMKSFVEPQFGYCPLVWVFHGRELNRRLNHIHERPLSIVYKVYISSFNDLLKKDKFVSIHHGII